MQGTFHKEISATRIHNVPNTICEHQTIFLLNHSTSTLGYQVIHFIQEFVEFYNFYFDIFKIIESQFLTKAP